LLQESADLLPNRAGRRLALAIAQFRSGCRSEARKTLAAAVRAYNWMESQAGHPTAWVSHVRVETVNTEAHYLAARCAALAGCGWGRDGTGLNPTEQSRWRKQART